VKITEGSGIWACSLAHNTFGLEGHVGAPRWGLGRLTSKFNYSHEPGQTKQEVG